jgi:hypothetical protein
MYLSYYDRVHIFARFTTGCYNRALQEARQLNGGNYIPAYCSLMLQLYSSPEVSNPRGLQNRVRMDGQTPYMEEQTFTVPLIQRKECRHIHPMSGILTCDLSVRQVKKVFLLSSPSSLKTTSSRDLF